MGAHAPLAPVASGELRKEKDDQKAFDWLDDHGHLTPAAAASKARPRNTKDPFCFAGTCNLPGRGGSRTAVATKHETSPWVCSESYHQVQDGAREEAAKALVDVRRTQKALPSLSKLIPPWLVTC